MINRFFVVQYKCSTGARQCLAPVLFGTNLTPILLYNTKAEDKVYYIY